MDNTKDNKEQSEDVTKAVKLKLRKNVSGLGDEKAELGIKPEQSSSFLESTSPQMAKKTDASEDETTGMNTKSSASNGLACRNTPPEIVKSDTDSEEVEKAKGLNSPKKTTTTAGEVTEKQTLKLRGVKSQSEITKEQTLDLRESEVQSSSEIVSDIKETNKTKNIDSTATSDKDIALRPPPLSEQSSTLDEADKNVKKPSLQIKKTSTGVEEEKEKLPLKDESGILNELEQEEALNVLSTAAITDKRGEDLKTDTSKQVKPVISPLTETVREADKTDDEFPDKNQKEYDSIFVLIAFLTLIGLIGLVISLASFSFFG